MKEYREKERGGFEQLLRKNLAIRQFQQTNSGHGGSSNRFDRYRDTALEHAFLLNLAGSE